MKGINYPAGDFLIRIKNAALADNKTVVVKKTKLITSVAEALLKLRFLQKIEEKDGFLQISLAYISKEPALADIKLVSKPGLRIYMGVEDLEKHRGPSSLIVSTPEGVMDFKEAIKKRLGGEVIAEIY